MNSFHPHKSLVRQYYYYSHFVDEDTRVQVMSLNTLTRVGGVVAKF